jgi:regulator of RNase E activity RraA
MTIKIYDRKSRDRFSHLMAKAEKADIAAIGHYTEFGFLDPGIHLLNPPDTKIVGRALTVKIPANESKALHLAVSMASKGDVIVVDRCLDRTHACLGEMVALGASLRGVAGVIVDGPVTDIGAIREIGLPVFARGLSALTTKFVFDEGEIGGDISCGGVVVHDGDLIMAGENGILVLDDPDAADALFDEALQSQSEEADERTQLRGGMTLQELYVPDCPLAIMKERQK